MGTKMSVGKKIAFGFGAVLLIAVAIGTTSSVQMSQIKLKAAMLADEFAPEVETITSLERNVRRLMFEIRGYGFTGNEHFLELSKEWSKRINDRLMAADDLANKSKNLPKLKPAISDFKTNYSDYEKQVEETKNLNHEIEKIRAEMNKYAANFLAASDSFLERQNNLMAEDFKLANIEKVKHRFEEINGIYGIIRLGNTIRIANFKTQALDDSSYIENEMKNFVKIDENLNVLKRLTNDDKNLKLLDEIHNSVDSYQKNISTFLQTHHVLEKTSSERFATAELITKKAEDVAKAGIEHILQIADGSKTTTARGVMVMMVGLIVACVVGAILSFTLVNAITKPIIRISNVLKESVVQVASASSELSNSSQQLSSAASEQASSIEESSSSLEEITGMVNNNVENAKHCVELAKYVNNSSSKGNLAMKQLVASMQEILESNSKIQDLVKVIGEIGEKTAIIDEIVFQTKLLSFNASVEAERAGEHGRGFAVVAQEVGNLAQMSGKAATEISGIVKDSIQNAENITNDNKKKVEFGHTIVKDTAKILEEITNNANSVLESVNNILQASQDQASGISQINTAISQLDKATQENAATAEESASSSEELNAQAVGLNSAIIELTTLVTGEVQVNTNQDNAHNVVHFKKKAAVLTPIKTKDNMKIASNSDIAANNDHDSAGWEKL